MVVSSRHSGVSASRALQSGSLQAFQSALLQTFSLNTLIHFQPSPESGAKSY